jgi:Protein of unknown function (DUF3703)
MCPAPFNSLLLFGPERRDSFKQRSGTRVADIVGMNATHERMLNDEVTLARTLMKQGDLDGAFVHLERAHVLGQASVRWHVLAHWLMFKLAIRRHQGVAALGQAVRIVLGAIGSVLGRVPTGNTGGSEVSMFARMPIAPELLRVMDGTSIELRAHGYPVERTKSWNT